MPDNLASGAYAYLSSLSDVLAVVGSFPADDPNNAGIPWIFQRNIWTRLEAQAIVKSSQAVALVTMYAGQFQAALDSNTARMQRLEVDIWVDPLRDINGNVVSPAETETRGMSVYGIIDSHLHRVATDQNTVLWGDLVTTTSTRLTEPTWYPVPDGDGLIRGAAFYAVATYGNNLFFVGSGDTGGGSGG